MDAPGLKSEMNKKGADLHVPVKNVYTPGHVMITAGESNKQQPNSKIIPGNHQTASEMSKKAMKEYTELSTKRHMEKEGKSLASKLMSLLPLSPPAPKAVMDYDDE